MSEIFMNDYRQKIDDCLKNLLPDAATYPSEIHQAMRYSLFAGGKRLRPIFCLSAVKACGGDVVKALPASCALEAVHTYSLIHDDLPGMDNDDYRRGKPTNHKVFGEGLAILAGDGLLTLAFEWLSDLVEKEYYPAEQVVKAIKRLAFASGVLGMVGGQSADLLAENKTPDENILRYIHSHKTGALISASVEIGGLLANANEQEMTALRIYGEHVGLAYQITDDILDIIGDADKIGKPIGSDLKNNKATFPALFGINQSQEIAQEAVLKALAALENLSGATEELRYLAQSLVEREA